MLAVSLQQVYIMLNNFISCLFTSERFLISRSFLVPVICACLVAPPDDDENGFFVSTICFFASFRSDFCMTVVPVLGAPM